MDDIINKKINYGASERRSDDEIDLYELFTLLWKKKFRILLSTLIFGSIGILYAMVAPEQWTASATIYQPKQRDTLTLDRLRTVLNIQGLGGTKNNKSIYNDFLLEFKSYNNISNYLQTTDQFKEHVANNNLGELEQQRLLRTWSEWMEIAPEDKKGEQPGIRLSFSFFKKEDALSMLTGYIDYIVQLQSQELLEILENNRNSQVSTLNLKIRLKTEDAQRKLTREIEGIEYSMSIAKAAGVNKPLENFNYGDRFPITLGEDALARKLSILKSLKIEEYMPEIMELNVQLARLKGINLGELQLSPFSYLDTPSQPLSRDKPKRPLIVVLATILGGILGVALVLLQHAMLQGRNKAEADHDFRHPRLVNAG
ncbi:LPS O-antigen chain length determinant protein WzzB [Aeromonas sp. A-5]|uniref:LPS O-antigen chain length determinant protein WzzB n=1 Tax=Aeromonas ichthyocola TaxID=3367746 RepID=UPI0038E40C1C